MFLDDENSDDEGGDGIQKLLQSSLSPRHSPMPFHQQLRQSIRSSMLKEVSPLYHYEVTQRSSCKMAGKCPPKQQKQIQQKTHKIRTVDVRQNSIYVVFLTKQMLSVCISVG